MKCSLPLLIAAVALVACGSDTAEDPDAAPVELPDAVYPGDDWVSGDPVAYGFDAEALEAMSGVAETFDSHCLLVTRRGAAVGEWYWDGWDEETQQPVFSVTKSATSTLIGIAQDEGALSIDDRASDYIEEWQGTDSEDVTIRNLISNDSGRDWNYIQDYVTMTLSADQTNVSIGFGQQHDPGAHWEYNNSAIQTLDRVLSVATGESPAEFANSRLFEPLGMHSSMAMDAEGDTLMYGDMSASCRDLARLGYLFLRGGEWADGVRVVSESWVQEATTPSTELNSGYGHLWWLNVDGHYVLPSTPNRTEGDGPRFEHLRDNVFMALGLGGQIILVDPDREIVMTHIAGEDNGVAAITQGGSSADLSAQAAMEALSPLLQAAIDE